MSLVMKFHDQIMFTGRLPRCLIVLKSCVPIYTDSFDV